MEGHYNLEVVEISQDVDTEQGVRHKVMVAHLEVVGIELEEPSLVVVTTLEEVAWLDILGVAIINCCTFCY